MEINTDNFCRCIQTLESSIEMLNKTPLDTIAYEIYRNAVVKGYELALETSGKLLRKALKKYIGSPRSVDELFYKDVLRQAAKHGLLPDEETVERWFAYRDNRNNTAHDYGIGFARDTLTLLPGFLKDAHTLETHLRKAFGND